MRKRKQIKVTEEGNRKNYKRLGESRPPMMPTYICKARRIYDGSVSIALPSDSNTFTKWPVLAIYNCENAFYFIKKKIESNHPLVHILLSQTIAHSPHMQK